MVRTRHGGGSGWNPESGAVSERAVRGEVCTALDFRRDWIITKFFRISMLVGAEESAAGGNCHS